MTYLGMQILIEDVALAAFSMGGAMFANPLIAQITEMVRRDEARHVAFGVLSLQGFYDEMDPIDLRVREEFLLESCAAIRDRFVPIDVFDRMGFDVEQATKEFSVSPDAMRFRNLDLIFSKVVPNLRKLGLLTPRVREGFETLGILRYASYVEPATYRLKVNGAESEDWMVTIGHDGVACRPGTESEHRDLELRMDVTTWTALVAGRVTAACGRTRRPDRGRRRHHQS